ncbi:lyase family protein [Kitasatospora aureofaciens]|uniref:argininosuccinate lyase n=1 Tax=Kitasatospora aureofaciens TaxID=1894 RepID=A0A1E7N6G9_KITAU|nr:lyase family protein [Kitasatospora aureofaciens]OEV36275.1 argininosuccinate lyase [Kitasatospora aureofaciens]GGU56623.1 argininosuccinate lyase [Kitasatospora aureofaciens]
MTVTGRIVGIPSEVWHEEVLAPQFAYEAEHLLRHYVAIEKVLLLEYRRMELVDDAGTAAIAARLDGVSPETVRANPQENMSDISFALERHVAAGPVEPFAAWHVDRSRNDLQVCAQLMSAREQVRALAADLLAFDAAVRELAAGAVEVPMPGYTHAQAAQVVSPGFYLAALSYETLAAVRRLLAAYDEIDASPLGAGSMAGQELAWDRTRMAGLLGFARPQPHALVAVASRGWALAIAAEAANFAVALSRFTTDLMAWGGSAHGFLDLPDELSGISAAMPQKKNFPVLERIRGRCALVAGSAAELAAAQRNTPYTNTVEVSKEAGAHLRVQTEALRSTLRLAHAVVAGLEFRSDRMRAACEEEFLGGFTLANRLTLDEGVPWRTAQIIAGRYIKVALDKGLAPADGDAALLSAIAEEAGHRLAGPEALLAASLSVEAGLRAKTSVGSTHPEQVRATLTELLGEHERLTGRWAERDAAVRAAADRVAALLAPSAEADTPAERP